MKIMATLVASVLLSGSLAQAATVKPVAYDMADVGFSAFYQDDSYNGTKVTSGSRSSYSGGTGELIDGFIAPLNYNAYENFPNPGGPYVAWQRPDPQKSHDIVIGFDFAALTSFNTATFYFDDRDGVAGVFQPAGISINGISAAIPVNSGNLPFSFTLNLQGLAASSRLVATIQTGGEWTHLSEVVFDAPPSMVPLPGSLGLLVGALGLTFAVRRRR